MKKLVIAADLHGFYTSWLQLKSLLAEGDTLVIAGDLFDSVYGSPTDVDFQPDNIRSEYLALSHPKHYVYGNCDQPDFFPGAAARDRFRFEAMEILLQHGDNPAPPSEGVDLVIEGHSHRAGVTMRHGIPHLNPGSAALPRDGVASYATLSQGRVNLIAIETGKPFASFSL